MVCEEILGSSYIQRCRWLSERVVPQIILLENLTKVQARSHEITNEPCTSSNYDNTAKNPTTDSKTNYDAQTNTSNVKKKIKNRRKQNLEDEANNMQLDK